MQAFKKTKIFFILFFLTSLLSIDGRADCPSGKLDCYKVETNPDNSVSLYFQGTVDISCCGRGFFHTDCEPCHDTNDTCNSTFVEGCDGQCNDYNRATCGKFIRRENIKNNFD